MSQMKNLMMDVETFCNGYYHGGMNDFTVGEVVEDVEMFFKSNEATKYVGIPYYYNSREYVIIPVGEKELEVIDPDDGMFVRPELAVAVLTSFHLMHQTLTPTQNKARFTNV
jgi:hypothetical protein